jgi:phosphoribosylformylglycinamidine synthase
VLRPNESLAFVCEDVPLRVERTDAPLLAGCEPGQRLTIPIKHGEGCFFADDDLLAELAESRQVVLRYDGTNPNGSVDAIAGVVNADGNVMGLMPHPEHAVDPLIGSGSTDGALILGALVERAREHLLAAVS